MHKHCCRSFKIMFSQVQQSGLMSGQHITMLHHCQNVSSHSTVNYSIKFAVPSGTHTQNIESYWNRVKTKLKRMKECHKHQLYSHLDKFMYREWFGITARPEYLASQSCKMAWLWLPRWPTFPWSLYLTALCSSVQSWQTHYTVYCIESMVQCSMRSVF